MNRLTKMIVSLFGIGFIPLAPGTVGSFFSIIFFYIIFEYFSFVNIIIIFLFTFFISLKLINLYSSLSNKYDPSEIVIDEFLGINFIFIFYEYFKFTNDIFMFVLIFIIFRLFDIIKFFPANWIDKNIKNSWGVILDDVVAGFYCVIILYTLNVFI
jgi:phosphatidylglycerophosphatase A